MLPELCIGPPGLLSSNFYGTDVTSHNIYNNTLYSWIPRNIIGGIRKKISWHTELSHLIHYYLYCWYIKLRIVLNTFWTKVSKSSHSARADIACMYACHTSFTNFFLPQFPANLCGHRTNWFWREISNCHHLMKIWKSTHRFVEDTTKYFVNLRVSQPFDIT